MARVKNGGARKETVPQGQSSFERAQTSQGLWGLNQTPNKPPQHNWSKPPAFQWGVPMQPLGHPFPAWSTWGTGFGQQQNQNQGTPWYSQQQVNHPRQTGWGSCFNQHTPEEPRDSQMEGVDPIDRMLDNIVQQAAHLQPSASPTSDSNQHMSNADAMDIDPYTPCLDFESAMDVDERMLYSAL